MPEIRMNYEMMQDMIQKLRNMIETLEEIQSKHLSIAQQMEDGVFVGATGTSLATIMQNPLNNKVNLIIETLHEQISNLQIAMQAMSNADRGGHRFL